MYDLIVIGAGPGGYVTAIRAAQLGLKAAIIEERHLGGICLNWGCIPTKALLRSAEVYHYMTHAKDYGLATDRVSFDLPSIVKRSRDISARLSAGVAFLLKKNKVEVIDGRGKLSGAGKVNVVRDGKSVGDFSAKHVILATGARPRVLPGIEPDKKLIWTYFDALVPDVLPKSLLVIGSGAIGVEFASFYRTIGVDVTVVEIVDQILPAEDKEIADFVRRRLEKSGIKIMTGAKVSAVTKGSDSILAMVDVSGAKQEIRADRVISAVGVTGNIENLGLAELGVHTKNGCIVVDGFGRTNVPGVYAIGDVAGAPMLAHKAEHEGVICVEGIVGRNVHPIDKLKIPGCTYSMPQVASVGLTEANARAAGYEIKVGRFPFSGNGKAIALGEDQGTVKTIFDARSGKLLGAHMVGAEVTELIQGFVLAMNLETTEEELMHTVFPHPTLSETMHESVLGAYGRAIHN